MLLSQKLNCPFRDEDFWLIKNYLTTLRCATANPQFSCVLPQENKLWERAWTASVAMERGSLFQAKGLQYFTKLVFPIQNKWEWHSLPVTASICSVNTAFLQFSYHNLLHYHHNVSVALAIFSVHNTYCSYAASPRICRHANPEVLVTLRIAADSHKEWCMKKKRSVVVVEKFMKVKLSHLSFTPSV